ncbi:MAG: class I SAM-dependent methyltransferase [Parvularculaceae bacterium]
MIKQILTGAAALILVACSEDTPTGEAATPAPAEQDAAASAPDAAASAEEKLDAVLAAQSDETKARYQYRHPKETLAFFGVEPGMTVVDTLPGKVWYSGILSDYLGADGRVIGADYSHEMWTLFGGFADEEFLKRKETWVETWTAEMNAERGENDAPFDAFAYGSLPEDMEGTADAVLVIRASHHFNRFEDEGGRFTKAVADMMNVLKPGGVVGVVQHRAPESNSDEWAEGDNGYVKQSRIISFFEGAGFEFVGASEINANPNDRPTEEEFVWRLPPTLGTSEDDPELRAKMIAIGESDRMTLKFRKPE